ncbi:hypothetical protein [Radicibacter daui]|uniref:hypothetical protein n=1 Tax=Radicibacter daui TaxID=3064829 RepID=UPI004046EBF3
MAASTFGPARFEGRISYMYLDTAGNVTVGIGHMLPSAAAASRLTFHHTGEDRPASAAESAAGWTAVKACPHGQSIPATRFNPARPATGWPALPPLRLEDDEIDALFAADIAEHAHQLEKGLPDFAGLPEPAREVLLDMHFNLGDGGLCKARWPSLFRAVEARDWQTAADQCRRKGIQQARNDWARETLASLA